MHVLRSTPGFLRTPTNTILLFRQRFCAEALHPTPTYTVRSVQEKWKTRFNAEKIPEADSSIVNILAHVLQFPSPADVRKSQDVILNETQLVKVDELCECRLARMPIQYIIREWEFRDLTLKMVPPVFIPRPETEELVELILQQVDTQKRMSFLEIGCGTGAISLSILKHAPLASAIALDQSKMACELTLENAQNLDLSGNLRIFRHKVIDKLPEEIEDQKFDMIVSNPPYVPSGQLLQLEPEIKVYEDMRALDGGPDGITVVKAILELAGKHLNSEGILWLEVDSSHPQMIAKYLEDKGLALGLKYVCSYKDLFQKERFVEIFKD
ncbi:MTRF1L release factor glutamine methyltransferase [Topomyia yanbarensis]|uniref:MTRF1L release factor glutamine methyltransferase n=1 Tax=Topomyia yanbarensis TaxID=2498891 RepID=UPI00273CC5F6|nr:MTRF1L release factor glutamine methyltransferase [Topomyia yanbarensis]